MFIMKKDLRVYLSLFKYNYNNFNYDIIIMVSRMKELVMIDKNGKKIKYEILATFHLVSTGKDYVVYTDNKKDDQGNTNTYALIYYPDDGSRFEEIKTKEELEAVNKLLEELNK